MKVRTDFHSVNLATGEKTRSIVGDGQVIHETQRTETPEQAGGERFAQIVARWYESIGGPWKEADVANFQLLNEIENRGFEMAHELRACGHSRGDYRDADYIVGQNETYTGSEKCIGCEREQEAYQRGFAAAIEATRNLGMQMPEDEMQLLCEGLADVAAGRVRPLEQIKKELASRQPDAAPQEKLDCDDTLELDGDNACQSDVTQKLKAKRLIERAKTWQEKDLRKWPTGTLELIDGLREELEALLSTPASEKEGHK